MLKLLQTTMCLATEIILVHKDVMNMYLMLQLLSYINYQYIAIWTV